MNFQTILLFQGGIVGLGLLLGWLFGLIPVTTYLQADAPLNSTHWMGKGPVVANAVGVGLALVMFGAISTLSKFDFQWMKKIESLLGDSFLNLVRQQPIWQLILLCTLAGVGEELLFRWAIQGGIERLLLSQLDLPASLAWSIATLCSALVFGFAHFVTRAYFLLATLIGFVMSLAIVTGGGLWGAMLAHGLYDLLALLWLLRR